MKTTTDRYINLFTDYGFKKVFGEEPNKDLLINFLNELLQGKEKITELTYLNTEHMGKSDRDRKAVFDLYCTNDKGEKFIVEVQRVKQKFFKDRSIYYSSFAIQEQAQVGKEWRYELKNVYTIAILDFEIDHNLTEEQEANRKNKWESHVQLMETYSKSVFYNKLTLIFLEIPKFNKTLQELENDYERWLFAFKNLHKLSNLPVELTEGIFKRLFEIAEIAKMDRKELAIYQESLKDYWDLKSAMDTYFGEGRIEGKIEGRIEGKIETAMNLINMGMDISQIAQATGLPLSKIEELKNE